MAIALRGTAKNLGASTSLVLAVPAGTVDGDVMYVVLSTTGLVNAPAPTITPPGGWTSVISRHDTDLGNSNTVDIFVYRRVASAEPANYTWGSTRAVAGFSVGYSGVDNTTPEDVVAASAINSTGGLATPALTTVTDNAWVISLWRGDATHLGSSLPPSNMTTLDFVEGASEPETECAHALVTSAGTFTPSAWTAGNSFSMVGASIALRAAGSATPITAADTATAIESSTLGTTTYVGSLWGGLLLDLFFPATVVTALDTVTATDLVAAILSSLTQGDAATATDAVAGLLALVQQSDAASAADALSAILGSVDTTDVATLADTVATLVVALTATDTATAADVLETIQAALALTDTVTVSETVTIIASTIIADDPVSAADALAALQIALTPAAEAALIAEVVAVVAEEISVPLASQGPWRKLDPNWLDATRARQRKRNKLARRLLF